VPRFGNRENKVEEYFHFRSLRLLSNCAMGQAVCRRPCNVEAWAQSQPGPYEIFRWTKNRFLSGFKVCKSVHHHTIQINQPTRCNNFSSLLLHVYVQLNMFRASSRS